MLKLHCFGQSGNAYKVAFALNAMGVEWEPVFVDFMNGITRTAAWRAQSNEMGEVPILEIDGKAQTQSAVILTLLAERFGQFGGRDADEQREIQRWMYFDNHKFTSYFASYRFMKAFGQSAPNPDVMAWLRGRIDGAFGIVDQHLAHSPFIVGARPTIADFSLCGYLFYPVEESGIDVAASYPHIGAWLARLKALPGWGDPYAIMPGERIAAKW
ncbi:glutathione S-transferase family protein [Massilia sp. TS11]|uniref:glutathione S-transferase family protein n=1 Tax=Massilia sp. TS11 TaxID=2908003 RepID=UPI001EDBA9F5|nr:glutathione S-transferase [Massilia sp. TS11]MCG2586579.1 glutathione S-transferase C-terminal domain-containing protein [Massilia sp. TS11]